MIKAINLRKTYYQGKEKIEAMRNANLEILKGEAVLVTGVSGAGKSTFLRLMGGLEKPTAGRLFFDGVDFYGLSDKARSSIRNEKIGFVFQFYHLLPEFTVLENVMLPALMRKRQPAGSGRNVREKAEGLLEIVGLENRRKHKPLELSGGESQRAAIARSLINSPEILLCDEPTGNLDSEKGDEIIECLRALKKAEKMSLVIVTHEKHMRDNFDKKFEIKDGVLKESAYEPQGLPEWQVCR